jgi:hypothetical protein
VSDRVKDQRAGDSVQRIIPILKVESP